MIKRAMKPPTDLAGYNPVATAPDGCWFDDVAAMKAIDFFPRFLVHIKGPKAGEPLELNPWERDVTATLFGWKRENGTRRYRECFVAVPRKNNKTTWCAGLALYALMCDGEQGAEVYCGASDKDQALMVFAPAMHNVRRNEALASRCKIREAEKRIIFNHDCVFRAIPADAAGAHGFNASFVIMDELHTQPTRHLLDVLRTSTAARQQPMTVSITTAGHDKESVCYEQWDYGRKVKDGVIDDPYFCPVIYEMAEGDDWNDPKVWARVNPNLGRSVSMEYLSEAHSQAKKNPARENSFRNLHLNEWTEAEERWISSESWDACEGEIPDLTGMKCYAGLDLASVGDITALVYVFPDEGKIYVKPHFWCPEETVRNAPKKYQRQYQRWFDLGLIHTTPGTRTDYGFIRAQIEEDSLSYHIQELGFDRWQALDTINYLSSGGVECVEVPQTFGGMWPGVKKVEEAVLGGDLVHDGNPVLRWMIASTVVDLDNNGNRKPSKKKSHGKDDTKGKIDGVVALCMAMGRIGGSEAGANYYEDNPLELV